MALDSLFHYARIRGEGRGWPPLLAALQETTFPALEGLGGGVWGTWFGLFGMHSAELILVTTWAPDAAGGAALAAHLPPGCYVVEQYDFVPTVRPESAEPRATPGLYVFRFFEVFNRDIDEVAALSNEAWKTFETSDAYQSEPQALFCERDRTPEKGTMLLLTWYDGLESWQRSRTPAPEASANFRRRAELTLGALPIATRLAGV